MAKSSTKRLMKRAGKRREFQLATHLERLGAAFCEEYKIKASEARLESGKDDAGNPYYYFTKYEPLKVNELPHDMKYLLDLCIDLQRAYEIKDGPAVKDGFRMMKELFDGFSEEETDGGSSEAVVALPHEGDGGRVSE